MHKHSNNSPHENGPSDYIIGMQVQMYLSALADDQDAAKDALESPLVNADLNAPARHLIADIIAEWQNKGAY